MRPRRRQLSPLDALFNSSQLNMGQVTDHAEHLSNAVLSLLFELHLALTGSSIRRSAIVVSNLDRLVIGVAVKQAPVEMQDAARLVENKKLTLGSHKPRAIS